MASKKVRKSEGTNLGPQRANQATLGLIFYVFWLRFGVILESLWGHCDVFLHAFRVPHVDFLPSLTFSHQVAAKCDPMLPSNQQTTSKKPPSIASFEGSQFSSGSAGFARRKQFVHPLLTHFVTHF